MSHIDHIETGFDSLLATAHDLGITSVTGQLGPPIAGRMWLGSHSLDAILCPDRAERQVAILIAPGGTSETTIHLGQQILGTAELAQLADTSAASGGSLTQGWLAVLTPAMWLERHPHAPAANSGSDILAAAIAAGWPASCDDNAVLFLDDAPLYALLAQANVGRAVTLLVATVATPAQPDAQKLVGPPISALPLQHTPAGMAWRQDASAGAIRVVQPDAWERPRSPQAPQPTEREPAIGDRVAIRQGRRAHSAFVGRTGTVVEIFRVPRDSCVVCIDGDDAGQPGLFCYHDEVVLCAT